MKRSAEKIVTSAKEKAPVDTGALQASITHKGLDGSYRQGAIVFTPTEYALYQEFGTVKMKAHPFMRPAFEENKTLIENDIKNFVSNRLRIIAK